MWRPEGWDNPCEEYKKYFGDIEPSCVQEHEYYSYEAGADAMLDALKKQFDSEHLKAYELHHMTQGCAGTWVFIPDED